MEDRCWFASILAERECAGVKRRSILVALKEWNGDDAPGASTKKWPWRGEAIGPGPVKVVGQDS